MAGNERPLSEVRFLTVAEVAAMMRVSKMTVYRLLHSGELPAVQIGRSYRVPEQAVDHYLRQSYRGRPESRALRRPAERAPAGGR
jgi:excisionase family DNA binding protein